MGNIKLILFFSFFLISSFFFSQIVEERIFIDTTIETISVVYKPVEKSTYYFKKIAVFANDTSQVAVEKSFNNFGQNGIYKVYYPSGRLKIMTVFANDKINGEWTYYDPSGIIITKGIYRNGVKHGYWAFKSLRIYGRYKKGLKNRKWKRFDQGETKHLSHYKNGVLTGGEGYGNETPIIIYKTADTTSTKIKNEGGLKISIEYEQAISFLTENVVFKKKYKEHFGGDDLKVVRVLKTHFKKKEFRYLLATSVINLDISKFIEESNNKKIEVAKIDSVLKENVNQWESVFDKQQAEIKNGLNDYSTDELSKVSVYLSPVYKGLMRVDVVWYKEFTEDNFSFLRYQDTPQNQKFRVLLYFNDEGILKGAEYEKP